MGGGKCSAGYGKKLKNPPGSFRKGSCCRGRIRTSTGQLAIMQTVVVNPSRPCANRKRRYITFILYPHPRDKRACLPKFHHSTV